VKNSKSTIFGLLGAALCLVLAAVAVHADDSLAPGRVGKLVMGMSLEAIYKVYPKEMTRKIDIDQSEEDDLPVHAVDIFLDKNMDRHLEPSLSVRLETADGGVSGIQVTDPRFKTADGIGVGSSLGQIRRVYKGLYITAGEGSLAAVVPDQKMAFYFNLLDSGLDDQTLRKIYENKSPWPHELKDDPLIPDRTKITSIWVH
jgi:hypothetical protein